MLIPLVLTNLNNYSKVAIIFKKPLPEFCCVHKIRNEAILKKFGQHLKQLRKVKNITQEELAYKAGLTLSQIARLETGRLNTSICTVHVLAEALELPASELLNYKVDSDNEHN